MAVDPSNFEDDHSDILMNEGGLHMEKKWEAGTSSRRAKVITNVPHHVVYNGQEGFNFGDTSDGSVDLALNALEELSLCMYTKGDENPPSDSLLYEFVAVRDEPFRVERPADTVQKLTWELYSDFLRSFVASAPPDGKQIPYSELRNWMLRRVNCL